MNEENVLCNTDFDKRVIEYVRNNADDVLHDHECIINYRKYSISAYSYYYLPMNERIALHFYYLGTDRIRRFGDKNYFITSMVEIELNEREISRNNSIKNAKEKIKQERINNGIVKKPFIEKPEQKEKYRLKLTKILDDDLKRVQILMKEYLEPKEKSPSGYYDFYMDMLEGSFHKYMGDSVDLYDMGDFVRSVDSENYNGQPDIVTDYYKDGRIIKH
jgi:hypothetical protein